MASAVRWLAQAPARALLVIFLVAFAEGTALLPLVPREWIEPHARWEANAVAVSLATTGRFADPYAVPTGPTAHVPPAFPALLGLLYTLFGLTMAAGYATWFVQVAASAAMVAMLPWLAHRLGVGREAGIVGGLAGALVPRWPHQVEYFAAVALGLLLAWHVSRWRRATPSPRGALVLGAAWGAAFHLTPSLVPVLLGCLLFDLWWSRDRRRWAPTALTLVGVALACVPWGLRNYAVFGEVFFIRSNLGLELRMGNHEGAVADIDVMDATEGLALRHPRTNVAEAKLLQQIGEVEYMRRSRQEALAWIGAHPGRFLSLTARRAFHFWFGSASQGPMAAASAMLTILAALGLRRAWPALAVPQRAALVIPLVTFPLVYYVVVFMPRYGALLTGILLLLAGIEGWHRIAPHRLRSERPAGWASEGDPQRAAVEENSCEPSGASRSLRSPGRQLAVERAPGTQPSS